MDAPIKLSTFPPPVTLTGDERLLLDSLPPEARQKFEALAAEGEFLRGLPIAQAEVEALARVVAAYGGRRG